MCFRKIWQWLTGGGGEVIPVSGNKVLLHFAIDDYPGTQNDLPDCVIDQNNIIKFFNRYYPEFVIRSLKNSEVTRSNFKNVITEQLQQAESGDKIIIGYSGHGTRGTDPYGNEIDKYSEGLYLHDGVFWDREFSDILDLIPIGVKVYIPLDSCFSKGSTVVKALNGKSYRKARYMPIQELKPEIGMARSYLRNNMNRYVVFAGCGENQTSSSTGNGGVFTLNWIKAWNRNFTHLEWINETARLTKLAGEAQIPNIDGDPAIINEIIFS